MMTPKEKAKELVDKYRKLETVSDKPLLFTISESRQCALIAVDEIISAEPTEPCNKNHYGEWSEMRDEAIVYWQQIKEEINNL